MTQAQKLQQEIKDAGLLKSFVAEKVGISPSHLSMMFNGTVSMPEETRNKITEIIKQARNITV
jgi:plasmid maintenance system antidote protein VapI